MSVRAVRASSDASTEEGQVLFTSTTSTPVQGLFSSVRALLGLWRVQAGATQTRSEAAVCASTGIARRSRQYRKPRDPHNLIISRTALIQ
eukprot:2500607-Pyramimonas_sp.AAC.1